MTKQFLNGSNVVAVFKKMCCKGMSEGVTTGVLIYSGFKNCLFYGFLQQGFIQMPAAFFSCFFVFPSVCLREQPLPFKLFGRRRIFFIQLIWHCNFSPAVFQILLMNFSDSFYLFFDFWNKLLWKHYMSVFVSLTVADYDFIHVKIHVKDS